jgi:hypothetical protein
VAKTNFIGNTFKDGGEVERVVNTLAIVIQGLLLTGNTKDLPMEWQMPQLCGDYEENSRTAVVISLVFFFVTAPSVPGHPRSRAF